MESSSSSSSIALSVHPSIVAQMPSLDFSGIPHRPLIGLLFAAGWCPDCTDVVPAIGKVASASVGVVKQGLVDIIYVGSDLDEESLLKFKPMGIRHIPIEAEEERANLKRTYQTCAGKEMRSLGLDSRKNGIPTLILLDSTTGTILSENGVDNVMQASSPEDTLNLWKALLTGTNIP